MIVVVEGVSASGKSTWCHAHFTAHMVGEPAPAQSHEAQLDERSRHEFWVQRNTERWDDAEQLEQRTGLAVCDTDPFKLHYTWGLRRIGVIPTHEWDVAALVTREAFAAGRLGLADLVLIADLPPEEVRRRREADRAVRGRQRRAFDLHLQLREPLRAWYEAVDRVEPGRVRWSLPADGALALPDPRPVRTGVALFDAVIAQLPVG